MEASSGSVTKNQGKTDYNHTQSNTELAKRELVKIQPKNCELLIISYTVRMDRRLSLFELAWVEWLWILTIPQIFYTVITEEYEKILFFSYKNSEACRNKTFKGIKQHCAFCYKYTWYLKIHLALRPQHLALVELWAISKQLLNINSILNWNDVFLWIHSCQGQVMCLYCSNKMRE